MSSSLQVVRKASFTPTPWKNGGGITHEAIRVPAAGDPFRWRVSVAHIESSGPFSDFAGYQRKMVLLRGEGLALRFGNERHSTLRHVGELVEFDGELAAHCELLNGPCVDLNLMVLKSDRATVRIERIAAALDVTAAPDETVVVFPVDRAISLQTTAGEAVALDPWDLAVVSHGGARLRHTAPGGDANSAAHGTDAALVFVATLHLRG